MNANLSQAIQDACLNSREKVAIFDVDGSPVTFAQLLDGILSCAARLVAEGVTPTRLVALDVQHPTVRVVLRFALVRLGVILVETSGHNLRKSFSVTPDFVVTDREQGDAACTGTLQFDSTWLQPVAAAPPISDAGQFVRSTSGTTGQPKLRVVSQQGVFARVTRWSAQRGAPSGPSFIGYSVASTPGVNRMLSALLEGQATILKQETTADTLRAMDTFGCTDAFVSPYDFNDLLAVAQQTDLRPRTLKRILVGGGAVHLDRAALAERCFGCGVYNTYGSNETGSIGIGRVTKYADTPGCIGTVHTDIEIRIDPHDTDNDGFGQICVKVPKDTQVLTFPDFQPIADPKGWVKTGDIGTLLPDRRLILVGRVSELLNVGGNKKAPSFFEEIAMRFDGIQAVAAFGLPDPSGTDRVGLAVVADDVFDLQKFAHFMAQTLGPQYPMQIATVTQLPSNNGGKVDRIKLRDLFEKSNSEQDY